VLKFLNEIANPYYKNCILNAILEKDKKDINYSFKAQSTS
jgi:hypothetical protein